MEALGEDYTGIVSCPSGYEMRVSHGMAYGRTWLMWLVLKIEAAAATWATLAAVQADSRVAQRFERWHMHMDAVDTHWWSDPDDTCLRRIGTSQMLGCLISWRQKRLVVATKTVGAGLGEAGLGEKAGGSSLRGDPLVVFQWDLACQVVSRKERKEKLGV